MKKHIYKKYIANGISVILLFLLIFYNFSDSSSNKVDKNMNVYKELEIKEESVAYNSIDITTEFDETISSELSINSSIIDESTELKSVTQETENQLELQQINEQEVYNQENNSEYITTEDYNENVNDTSINTEQVATEAINIDDTINQPAREDVTALFKENSQGLSVDNIYEYQDYICIDTQSLVGVDNVGSNSGYVNNSVIRFTNPNIFNSNEIKIYKTETSSYTRPGVISVTIYDNSGNIAEQRACLCLNLGASLDSGTLVENSSDWASYITSEQWYLLNKLFSVSNSKILTQTRSTYTNITREEWDQYFSTQLCAWYILGQIDLSTLVKNCTDGYGDLNYCIKTLAAAKYRDEIPSFASNNAETAPVYELEFNVATDLYEVEITDTKFVQNEFGEALYSVLKNWNPSITIDGVSYTKVGDMLKITSSKPIGNRESPCLFTLSSNTSTSDIYIFGKSNVQTTSYYNIGSTINNAYIKLFTEGKGRIVINKTDFDTKDGIGGVVFDIFSDKECSVKVGEIVTDNYGQGISMDLPIGIYYIRESQAAVGYIIDQAVHEINVVPIRDTFCDFTNKKFYGSIQLHKINEYGDNEYSCSLAGAVYGLYQNNNKDYPDELIMLFPPTNKDGYTELNNISCGDYIVKEITPPRRINEEDYIGIQKYTYYLDSNRYNVSIEDNQQEILPIKLDVYETPIVQPLKIVKFLQKGDDTIRTLEDVGFTLYSLQKIANLHPEIGKVEDKQFDFSKLSSSDWETISDCRVSLTSSGEYEIYTDEFGIATTVDLYCGKYILRETSYPDYVVPMEPALIDIVAYGDNDIPLEYYTYFSYNKEIVTRLQINKIDSITKEPLISSSAVFKIFDLDHNQYFNIKVVEGDKIVTIDEFSTNTDGFFILNNNIPVGNYRLEEISAPKSYSIGENIYFKINSSGVFYKSSDDKFLEATLHVSDLGDKTYSFNVENSISYGQIVIDKRGETICGGKETFTEYGSCYYPEYKDAPLENVTYNIYDENNIFIESIITDKNGRAKSSNLITDSVYFIREAKAPSNYIINSELQEVFLKAGDRDKVVNATLSFNNLLCDVNISIHKTGENFDSLSTEIPIDNSVFSPLEGAVFGLYAGETIYNNKDIIAEKNSLIGICTTNENGIGSFSNCFLLTNYYVKELKAPDGYIINTNTYPIDIIYNNSNQVIMPFLNEPIKNYLETSKVLSATIVNQDYLLTQEINSKNDSKNFKLGKNNNYGILIFIGLTIIIFVFFSGLILFYKKIYSKKRHHYFNRHK